MNMTTTVPTCGVCEEAVSSCTRTHVTDSIRTTKRALLNENSAIPVISSYDIQDRQMKMHRTGAKGETPLKSHWLENPGQGTYISISFTIQGTPAIAEHIIGNHDIATDEGETRVPHL